MCSLKFHVDDSFDVIRVHMNTCAFHDDRYLPVVVSSCIPGSKLIPGLFPNRIRIASDSCLKISLSTICTREQRFRKPRVPMDLWSSRGARKEMQIAKTPPTVAFLASLETLSAKTIIPRWLEFPAEKENGRERKRLRSIVETEPDGKIH